MATSPFPPKPEKRSPFPEPSLPQPGESGREALFDFALGRLGLPFAYAIGFSLLALLEWDHYLFSHPPMPWVFTIVAIGCIAFTAWRFVILRPAIEAQRLGIRGERIIGRILDDLRRNDYRVYHDLPSGSDVTTPFNVDHLIVGPAGIFVIETKTISKPGQRKAKVTYDGQRVLIDSHAPDRDPIEQVEALTRHVRDLLQKQTGRQPEVRGVVLYPKWWVDGPAAAARVWVLNPEQLPSLLGREPTRLSPEAIALFANAVEVSIRQAS